MRDMTFLKLLKFGENSVVQIKEIGGFIFENSSKLGHNL